MGEKKERFPEKKEGTALHLLLEAFKQASLV